MVAQSTNRRGLPAASSLPPTTTCVAVAQPPDSINRPAALRTHYATSPINGFGRTVVRGEIFYRVEMGAYLLSTAPPVLPKAVDERARRRFRIACRMLRNAGYLDPDLPQQKKGESIIDWLVRFKLSPSPYVSAEMLILAKRHDGPNGCAGKRSRACS